MMDIAKRKVARINASFPAGAESSPVSLEEGELEWASLSDAPRERAGRLSRGPADHNPAPDPKPGAVD